MGNKTETKHTSGTWVDAIYIYDEENKTKHTDTPWAVRSGLDLIRIESQDRIIVEEMPGYGPISRANARRIVAAVNACEGFPTQALESGVVADLLEIAKTALFLYKNPNEFPTASTVKFWEETITKTEGGAA